MLPNNVYRILANGDSFKTEIFIYYPDVKIGISSSKSVILQKYLLTISAQTMRRNGDENLLDLDCKYIYAWAMLTVIPLFFYTFRV